MQLHAAQTPKEKPDKPNDPPVEGGEDESAAMGAGA
jgi:hypothetical protein